MEKVVVQICNYSSPYSGNFITSLIELSNQLKNHSLRQVLILPLKAKDKPWISRLHENKIKIYFISEQNSVMKNAKEIAKIVNQENGQIIHTHFTNYDIPAWIVQKMLILIGKKVKVYWHFHSAFPTESTLKRRMKNFLKLKVIGRDIVMIAVSKSIYLNINSTAKRKKNLYVIENGIDKDRVISSKINKEELRSNLAINENDCIYLCFGWDPITKGIDLVLKAFEKFSGEGNNSTLVIVGESRLIDFVNDFFEGDKPSWLKILPPNENVADYYHFADVFISSSRWEGFNYSIGEAALAELPLIVSDIPGVEWTKNLPAVNYFALDDVDGLVKSLNEVRSSSLRIINTNTKNNRLYIEKEFSLKKWSEKLINKFNI